MKKMFRKLHLWIAFPTGIIVTILCLTGAILVFRAEIEEMLYPERYFVKEIKSDKLPLHELMSAVNSRIENDVATGVAISSDPKRTYTVTVASDFHRPQYVDPYSGKLVEADEDGSFFSVILRLHRWMLLDRNVGKEITGWTTLLFVIILITGAIIVIPKKRKGWKQIFKISVSKGWKRFWYDIHLSAGAYVVLVLLMLSLTALTWSFRWYGNGVYKLFGVEQPAGMTHPQSAGRQTGNSDTTGDRRPSTSDSLTRPAGNAVNEKRRGRREGAETSANDSLSIPANNPVNGERRGRGQGDEQRGGRQGGNMKPADFTHWQKISDEIEAKNPNFRTISIRNEAATVTRKFVWGNVRASDRYTFDEKTGEITGYQPYERQTKALKMRGWLYTLHVGAWGGLFSKIITCIASLIGASMPLTGYYIWIVKRKNKLKLKNTRRRTA
jgi:uncharacterized iron-regulated membrane protein